MLANTEKATAFLTTLKVVIYHVTMYYMHLFSGMVVHNEAARIGTCVFIARMHQFSLLFCGQPYQVDGRDHMSLIAMTNQSDNWPWFLSIKPDQVDLLVHGFFLPRYDQAGRGKMTFNLYPMNYADQDLPLLAAPQTLLHLRNHSGSAPFHCH
jgi:hypothetical protein